MKRTSDRFIDLAKKDFIGREAAMSEKRSRAGSCGALTMIVDGRATPMCWAMSRSGMMARWSAG